MTETRFTPEEIDDYFAHAVVTHLMLAGKSRADCVVTDTGRISHEQWFREQLTRRDAALAKANPTQENGNGEKP